MSDNPARRSPCEYFLRYLIFKGATEREISSFLYFYNYLEETDEMINQIKEEVLPPESLTDKIDTLKKQKEIQKIPKRLKTWLKEQGIYDAATKHKEFKKAIELNSFPEARRILRMYILACPDSEEAMFRFNQKMGLNVQVSTVKAFNYYFWNKNLLDLQEWTAYIDELLLNPSIINDPEMAELDIFPKRRKRNEDIVQDIIQQAYRKFKSETTRKNCSAKDAGIWAGIVYAGIERSELLKGDTEEYLRSIARFKIRRNTLELQTKEGSTLLIPVRKTDSNIS